jgi:quinone-modifying oxidoreductase subunit QmoC
MSQTAVVRPDQNFVKDLVEGGADTLKKCFQCATCSVVCNVSPDERPFPRKEMIWAQWGLRDRLVKDPDVWLCHQCNDCSKHCPRGARPGDVLAVLRRMTIREAATPRIVAEMVNKPKFLPVVFGIPVGILLVLMAIAGTLKIPQGEIVYAKFVPHIIVDPLYLLTAFWAVVCGALGIKKLWAGFKEVMPAEEKEYKASPMEFTTLYVVPTVVEILKHNKFLDCVVNRVRYLSHLNLLWGFILLAITTASVATGVYLFGYETPWPLYHPVKWIGNLGAVMVIAGGILAIRDRVSRDEVEAGKATYFDWLFVTVVLATGATGLLTEILRLIDVAPVAYPMYFIHLVFVWFLFAYLPFSKFAHLLYRSTAMVYTRYTGREARTAEVTTYQWPEAEAKKAAEKAA